VNLAVLIPLCAATINLTSGILLVAISRAPGWRVLRTSSAIAFTAGAYCLTAVVYGIDGLDTAVYVTVAQATYVAAFLHALAWLVFAFGGPDASPREVPRAVRWIIGVVAAIVTGFAATSAHLEFKVTVVDVAWAGVKYHYPVATPAGDALGLLVPVLMSLVLWRLVQRARGGERELRWHIAGFVIFLVTVVDEVLVANRVVVFMSLADFGIVAVVLPLTITMVRRVIADARRLAELSGSLEDQVRQRTEERDRAQHALVESERLASLGRLAAGVGHEVNNPLTYMQLALEDVRHFVKDADVPEPVREAVSNAEDGARRIQKVVEGLRTYSRRQESFERLDLAEVARAAMKVAWPRLRHVAAVDLDLQPSPAVMGDEASLVQAAVNLLTNAAQAVDAPGGAGFPPPPGYGEARRSAEREGGPRAGDGARIVIRTGTSADGGATLAVIDNGPGIPPELLARISEPYFTTRSKHGGLGLGLFVTRGIIDAHGGRFEFSSPAGEVTTVTIVLPAAAEAQSAGDAERASAAAAESAAAAADGPARGLSGQSADAPPLPIAGPATPGTATAFELFSTRGRVLLVDDEPLVRDLLARALGRTWDVTTVASGEEALRLLDEARFDAIVCDLMMPGMSGIEVAEAVWARDPRLRQRMIFLTGGAVVPEAEAFLERPDVRHFTKPVKMSALNAALLEVAPQG
jgi:signal transduction histidine kinase